VNELPVHNFIFNIVAGIVQTFIKSWNQLLYPRVIEVCLLPFEPRHDFFLHLIIVVEPFFQRDISSFRHILPIHNVTINSNNWFVNFRWTFTFCVGKFYDGTHFLFGRDFGSVLPFQRRLTQTKPVLTLSTLARLTGKGSRSTAVLPQ